MVLAFERGMTSPMNIIVVVVSRPINVKVANIGTVLWATVSKGVVSFTLFEITCDVGGAEVTPKSKGLWYLD